jgi:hypothetical protein
LKHLGFVAFPITRVSSISTVIFPNNNTLILERTIKADLIKYFPLHTSNF